MKTAAEFQMARNSQDLTEWLIHDCAICGYHCGYLFDGEHVFYDSGCYCTSGAPLRPKTWQHVADHYNMQTHPDTIAKYNTFWGFQNV